jgi:GAF domain-containing protein
MAEQLLVNPSANREEKYQILLPQIAAMVAAERNLVAVLANVAAAIRQSFGFFWVGFYLKDSEEELVLGPFQGDIACTRIGLGKGVCGTAWKQKKTIVVPDVDQFEGHIACSSLSKSEIVVPVIVRDEVKAVLDVDSTLLSDFSDLDAQYLERLCAEVSIRFD